MGDKEKSIRIMEALNCLLLIAHDAYEDAQTMDAPDVKDELGKVETAICDAMTFLTERLKNTIFYGQ